MKTRAVLHVGMGKCGSSALQAALTRQPELSGWAAGPGCQYVALHKNGLLVAGRALQERAATSTTGYSLSVRFAHLDDLGSTGRNRLRDLVREVGADGRRLILSNEAWGHEHEKFASSRYLEQLDLDCEVVVYVRPQVDWCNSAWWQWGAWKDVPLQRWLRNQNNRIQWANVVRGWRSVPGVSSVRVRLLPDDIVADFCSLIGVVPPPSGKVNRSMPEAVVRLFQRHRSLRATADQSAIEFVINRHLQFDGPRTPWVLNGKMVAQVIDACRAGNMELLGQLDEDQQARMRENAAWWSPDFYAQKPTQNWQTQAADAAQVDQLAAATIEALFRLDASYRESQSKMLLLERDLERLRAQPGSGLWQKILSGIKRG